MPGLQEQVNELHEKLNTLSHEMRDYMDNKIGEVRGEAPSDQVDTLDRINARVGEVEQHYNELRKELSRPSGGLYGGQDNSELLTPEQQEQRSALNSWLRSGEGMLEDAERRALSNIKDTEGGYFVTPDFESEIIQAAYNTAEVRPIVQVGTTGSDRVFIPALSKPAVAWGTQNLAVSEQQLSTGGERIEIHDLQALTLVHNNTLEDSEANLVQELTDSWRMAVAEAEDDAMMIGSGADQPQGVLTDSRITGSYKVSLGSSWLDSLIDALHRMKKAYRRNATFAMNSTTEGEVRKIKNNDGDYIWQPPVTAGNPAALLGRPIINPEGMPDAANGTLPIAVGDFRSGYKLRDRSGVTVRRLVEKYAEYNQVGFILRRRLGGQPVQPEAFRVLEA